MGTGIRPCSSLADRTFTPLALMPVYPRFDAYRLRCEVAAACVVTSGHSVIPILPCALCVHVCAYVQARPRRSPRQSTARSGLGSGTAGTWLMRGARACHIGPGLAHICAGTRMRAAERARSLFAHPGHVSTGTALTQVHDVDVHKELLCMCDGALE